MSSTNNHQAQRSLLLLDHGLASRCAAGSRRLVLLALGAAEFLGVGENEVHVSVVGEHLANQLSRVLQRHTHPVVDLGAVVSALVLHVKFDGQIEEGLHQRT